MATMKTTQERRARLVRLYRFLRLLGSAGLSSMFEPRRDEQSDRRRGRHVLVGGEVLMGVHPPDACAGEFCTIHHISHHHMEKWPQHWRGDRGIMERICPDRGIGHPDPDDYRIVSGLDDGTHGCDGCCITPEVEA